MLKPQLYKLDNRAHPPHDWQSLMHGCLHEKTAVVLPLLGFWESLVFREKTTTTTESETINAAKPKLADLMHEQWISVKHTQAGFHSLHPHFNHFLINGTFPYSSSSFWSDSIALNVYHFLQLQPSPTFTLKTDSFGKTTGVVRVVQRAENDRPHAWNSEHQHQYGTQNVTLHHLYRFMKHL